MSVAFLITSPYQLFHYKWIARHVSDVVALIEIRDTEYGLSDNLVLHHMSNATVEYVRQEGLRGLDGRFDVIVCQTPILPLEFLTQTYVVAQQYSLAKETYQYGVWRAHASLNLMYGPYSAAKVNGFSNAVAVGNPLLDPHFQQGVSKCSTREGLIKRVLYMPTYGELSSLNAVIPRLCSTSMDVTVKLHHAHDLDVVSSLPKKFNVVYSDADPVALFRDHDAVISDFSGAAFDALYAGLPVVLAGRADPAAADYRRLSAQERRSHALHEVTAHWAPDADLQDCLAVAAQLIDVPRRKELLSNFFVNPGSAGEAAARQIQCLMETGEPDHFGAQQVRTATKRYIVSNRELKSRLSSLRSERRAVGISGVLGRSMSRAYRHTRGFVARSQLLRRIYRASPGNREPYSALPPLPAPPRDRRDEIWNLLAPLLVEAGVVVARDHNDPGTIAILTSQLPRLRHALKHVGDDHADLWIRVNSDTKTLHSVQAASLRLGQLQKGEWLQVGSVRSLGPYRTGLDGYLTILLVRRDFRRNRYLSLYGRAQQVDWTESFESPPNLSDRPLPITRAARRPHAAAPIDVVYTWVDSSDSNWRRQHSRYSGDQVVHNASANNDERYMNREELRYSLRSLWMFAPFIRNIYIVTADQRPTWLADHPRVTLVSHRDIFPDPSVLPTFNSHAIEACIHRIAGLSENFLYFNDDVFLGRETNESDYFTQAGLSKVRFSPTQFIYDGEPEPSAIPTDWAAYNSMRLLQRDYSLYFTHRFMHIPLPLKRGVMYEIEERYPDEVFRTRAARFRATTDLAIPSMFSQYYSIATHRAVEWPHGQNEYVYVDTGRSNSHERFARIATKRPKFFCLNVTRYNEIELHEQAQHLRDFMTDVFPVAAPWESDFNGRNP